MANDNNIGYMIIKIREQKEISQQALCLGICSQKMMSRYEAWKNVPDRLSLNLILQRLGKSPGHFVTLVTNKELQYFQWRKEVLLAMKNQNIEKIRELLGREEALDRNCHKNLQEQFYCYMKGYIEKDISQMQTAIELTIPGYRDKLGKEICISSVEMGMILLCLQMKEKNRQTREELEMCIRYIEEHYEEEEQLKTYPGAICLYSEFLEADKLKRIVYCKKAVELLSGNGRIQELPILLEYLCQDLKEIIPQEAEHYQNQLRALQEVYAEQGIEIRKEPLAFNDLYQEVFVLSDVLKTYRAERGYSRETASEDIVDVTSYGRIESGARGINKSNYEKLANRLEIPYGKYSTSIVTDDYECLVLEGKLNRASKQHNLEEIGKYLQLLKEKLDLTDKINQQCILKWENELVNRLKQESPKEFRENAVDALRLTIPNWNENYGPHYYTKTELRLVNQVVLSYSHEENYKTADDILNHIWTMIKDNRINMSERVEELLLLLSTWKNILSDSGRYNEAIKLSDVGIQLSLRMERGDKLDTLVSEKGWAREKLSEELENTKEKRLKYYLQAYYLSILFKKEVNQRILKDYVKLNYGLELN